MSRAGAVAAELLADRGEAAAAPEFFRCREFLDAEGVTHTLRIGHPEGELLAPLIVREIPGEPLADAASPYGYPGFGTSSAIGLDPAELDLSATGLVSIFIRHRLAPAASQRDDRAQHRADRRPRAAPEEPDERPPADPAQPEGGL